MDMQSFAERYPATPNAVLAAQMGITVAAVNQLGHRHGLRKDREYISALHRATGALATVPKGPAHPNWQGGKPWNRFADPQYLAWRQAVLERDHYICQSCFRECKKREKGLAAHHVRPYAKHPELRYEVSNGRTLCRECHMRLHGKPFQVQMIPCACGCGTLIRSKDLYSGRPRRYANFHAIAESARKRAKPKDETQVTCACGCGTLIRRVGARGQPIRFAPGHVTRERIAREGVREETRRKISEARKHDVQERQRNERGQFA